MIGVILAALCDRADRLGEAGRLTEREETRECINVIHDIWRDYEKHKIRICGNKKAEFEYSGIYTPSDKIEELVLTIPGIEVYQTEKVITFKLDGHAFNDATEVLMYLVKDRERAHTGARRTGRREIMQEMVDVISKLQNVPVHKGNWRTRSFVSTKVLKIDDEDEE